MRRILIAVLVLMTFLATAPRAQADPIGDPQCMPVYQEYDVGPVKVVRRNSCSAEVYLFGEPILR